MSKKWTTDMRDAGDGVLLAEHAVEPVVLGKGKGLASS